jgi:hypothetical protein
MQGSHYYLKKGNLKFYSKLLKLIFVAISLPTKLIFSNKSFCHPCKNPSYRVSIEVIFYLSPTYQESGVPSKMAILKNLRLHRSPACQ